MAGPYIVVEAMIAAGGIPLHGRIVAACMTDAGLVAASGCSPCDYWQASRKAQLTFAY
jgi:hypothetical protein